MVLGFSTFHFSGLGREENVLLEIDLTGKVVWDLSIERFK